MAPKKPKPHVDPNRPDTIEGVPAPAETARIFGHGSAESAFLSALRAGRLHHAWLIVGPRGIGKATLAFAMTRHLLSGGEGEGTGLAMDPDTPAALKIAHGTHPNLLHLHRPWDEKTKRFKTEITVDSVRRIIPFLGTTAAEGRWRIVLVDSADDLNRNSANALLKSLEEPPRDTVFILVCNRPGLLPPTIRSRCRVMGLDPLGPQDMDSALAAADASCLKGPDRDLILSLAQGSPRRAIELTRQDGVEVHRKIAEALSTGNAAAMQALAGLSADIRGSGFQQVMDLYMEYLHRRIRGIREPEGIASPPGPPLATWADLWEKAAREQRDVESLNLDRKHHVLAILERAYSQAARGSAGKA